MSAAAPTTQPPATTEAPAAPKPEPQVQLTRQDVALARDSHRLRRYRSLPEFGFALVNSLCNQFQCEQVGLGMTRGSVIRMLAISGCAHFKHGSPGIVDMCQAMEEAMDEGTVITYPELGNKPRFPIHRQWFISCHGAHVGSLPLIAEDQVIGVISFKTSADRPITREWLEQLQQTVEPYSSLLPLIDRANQPATQLLKQIVANWRAKVGERHRPVAFVVTALLIFLLLFSKTTYRPLCDSVVEAAELRHMTAPLESRLETVHVAAGDTVKAGDILAEFDTRPLQLELETLRAETARTEVSARAAVQAGDVAAAALQKSHVQVLRTRQNALGRRIESAKLRAPSDGMVIQSHVEKKLGQVFSLGDPVLQFASHDGWRLRIHVPEGAALELARRQHGTFTSKARPNDRVKLRVTQIDGAAEVIDGKNVFVARAELDTSPSWMRSGMQGTAQIDTTRKPIWWVMFHRMIDWTRLHFWI